MAQRIGLYGGSFDPIHFGHLISARSLAEQLSLNRVVLIPAMLPPHKQTSELTDARHRLEMARLAVQGDPLFEVSDAELHRAGPSYTFDTVTQFRQQLGPQVELFWFIGADSLPELPSWYRVAELVKVVRIVTAARPGWTRPDPAQLNVAIGSASARQLLEDCLETPRIDISATEIRARVRSGLSIRYLVPERVASYIASQRLYQIP